MMLWRWYSEWRSLGWEECDNGTFFNDRNNVYESVPPSTNNQPCNSSCSIRALGGVGSCQVHGWGIYYIVGEVGSLTCENWELRRKLYSNSTCTTISPILAILPNNVYTAWCVDPVCNNASKYACSVGNAINKNGDNWICHLGGVKRASCSYSPPTTYSYRKCGVWPSWYNYGSPSNPNGGLTTCSPETSLGSSYAMGDFVCRSSQPSASICGNTTSPTFSCTTLPSNSVACAGTPAPSSNTNYSLAATCANAWACTATCQSPYVYNGSSCVLVSYTKYTCHSSVYGNHLLR